MIPRAAPLKNHSECVRRANNTDISARLTFRPNTGAINRKHQQKLYFVLRKLRSLKFSTQVTFGFPVCLFYIDTVWRDPDKKQKHKPTYNIDIGKGQRGREEMSP